MRRLISIPLLVLYMLASLGLHGVSHFCGDEWVNTAFYEVNDKVDCGEEDMGCTDSHSCCSQPESKTECCSDVTFILLFEPETTAVNIPKKNVKYSPALPFTSSFLLNSEDADFAEWVQSDVDEPAPSIPTPLYIQYHSLIFYG